MPPRHLSEYLPLFRFADTFRTFLGLAARRPVAPSGVLPSAVVCPLVTPRAIVASSAAAVNIGGGGSDTDSALRPRATAAIGGASFAGRTWRRTSSVAHCPSK